MRNVIALFYFVGSENPCIYSVPNRKQSYEYWKTIAQDCFGIPRVKLLMAENLDIEGADAKKLVSDAISAYGLA